MFVGGMNEEAEVSEIKGLSPTISIDQKTTSKNPRSTVGTITEIYDYYKLLFLNVGIRHCTQCDHIVKKDSLQDVIDFLSSTKQGQKFMILSPIQVEQEDEAQAYFEAIQKQVLDLGFIRFCDNNGDIYTINDSYNQQSLKDSQIYIVIDRLLISDY